MNALIRFSIHHKLLIGLLTIVLAGWGAWSLSQLPFDSTPDITNNQVQVIAQAPSLGAQEVEQNITTPIEMALANIPNVTERRSISRSGLAVITLVFDDDVDVYWARQQISQQLAEAEEALPQGKATTSLGPVATGLGEIYQYTIRAKAGYEDRYTLTDLRALQDWVVRKQLAGTPGVAEVSGWGGFVKQYEVAVDADRLVAAGVTIPEVYEALAQGNENAGGSYIEKESSQYYIRGLGLVQSLDDIRRIPVKTVSGLPILVGDVATVRLCHATRYGAVTRNGEGEVVAAITLMLKGENFQEVIARVKDRIAQIQKTLPEGVVIEPFIDRTQLVDRVTSTIARNLIEGGLIVVFILVLFLGNARAGLIVASVIPLAMLFAFGMMRLTGVSGNLMSLGAIDFGLIVDGAVIIVEAVVAHLARKAGPVGPAGSSEGSDFSEISEHSEPSESRSSFDALVEQAACRIRKSAAYGEIIIMTVYLPLMTLTGIEGKMFRPMAMTIFFAILGAFILSLTYVPMASALFLSRRVSRKQSLSDRLMSFFHRAYGPVLDFALRWSRTLIAAMLLLLGVSIWQFGRLGGEFIPSLEEGDFAAELSMAQGTSLSQMVETMTLAEKLLRERFPEIRQAVTRIGSAEIPTDPMPVERADMLIALKPKAQWTSATTKDELIEKMETALSDIPGLEAEITQPIQMRNNELITGIRQDVAIKIYGSDLDVLSAQASRVADLIKAVPGVGDPYIEQVQGLPQIQVTYNRDQLARYGIPIATANGVLETAFAGRKAGVVYEGSQRYDVVLRLDDDERARADALPNLALPTQDGSSVPLAQVATIAYQDAPAQVTHDDGERRIYVGFNVRGRDVQSTVRDIQKVLDEKLKLPTGYYYKYGGEFQNLQEATDRLLVAVPLALVIILCLLFATVRNLRETLLVFTAIPLSAIGGVWALTLRGLPFSISAGVGFIALFGVAVLNGIVLVGQFNQLERDGVADAAERIRRGCQMRLRPVLMTALVASLGFLPMAVSTGDGAEVQRPLATVVIGGLLTATLLTLLVLPSGYKLLAASAKRLPADFSENSELSENSEASDQSAKKPSRLPKILLPLLLLTASGASAQSLDSCQALALRYSTAVRLGEKQVERAQALQGTACNLPATSVALSQDFTDGGSPDNGLTISQEFALPSVYSARRKQLRAETELERRGVDVTRQQLRRDVAAAYWTLVYQRERVRLLTQQDSIYADFVRLATAKCRGGETSRLEQLNAERVYQDNRMALLQANADQNMAALRLAQLTGTPIEPSERALRPISEISEASENSEFSENSEPSGQMPPLAAYLAQQEAVAKARLAATRKEALPTFSVGLTGQLLIKGLNPYHIDRERFREGDLMAVEVGMSIPLTFGATKAKRRAAQAEVEMAVLQTEQVMRQRDAQLLQLQAERQQAQDAIAYYGTQARDKAADIARTSTVSYRYGEIDYIEHTQNLQTAIDAALRNADAINQYNQAVIQIRSLSSNPRQ